jgi:uncharacterized membrane protein YGL010W
MKHLAYKFAYQGAKTEILIFWGLIISALSLAVVIQCETVGFSWIALIVALATLFLALWQLFYLQGQVQDGVLRLQRLLPSNTLTITLQDVQIAVTGKHSVRITGSSYGDIDITSWIKAENLIAHLR